MMLSARQRRPHAVRLTTRDGLTIPSSFGAFAERASSLGQVVMNGKPRVVLALARRVYEMMFDRADLARLGEVASIAGPTDSGAAGEVAPLLRDAVVALAGWGSARFDES